MLLWKIFRFSRMYWLWFSIHFSLLLWLLKNTLWWLYMYFFSLSNPLQRRTLWLVYYTCNYNCLQKKTLILIFECVFLSSVFQLFLKEDHIIILWGREGGGVLHVKLLMVFDSGNIKIINDICGFYSLYM